MKLSTDTLAILKNFANINQNLEFKKGNSISTTNVSKSILATVTLKDDFPEDFCVYDLNQFLSVHSLNKNTEIDFDDSNIIFISGRSKINYRKSDKSMIVFPTKTTLNLPSKDISFILSEEDLNALQRSISVLQSQNVSVNSDGNKIYITAFDAKNDSAHTNSIEVADGNGVEFSMVFIADNLKLISGSYDVEITAKGGVSHFKHKTQEIDYWIATEDKFSTYRG